MCNVKVCKNTTRQRKTIENNKEQPLKQHAEPVYRRMPTVTLKLFTVIYICKLRTAFRNWRNGRSEKKRERVRAEAEGRESKLCLRMSVIHLVDGVFAFGKTMHMGIGKGEKALHIYAHIRS